MVPNEITHVAIIPPDRLEPNIVKQVADIINKDAYETRLLLAGTVPRIVAHYKTAQTAELAARSLGGLGLAVMVCNDSELRKTYQSHKATAMAFEDRTVVFRDKAGQTKRMAPGEVFLIIKGNIQTRTETETTRTDKKLNLPATIVTGGIPIFNKVEQKTKDRSVRAENFLRFYGRTSPEPSVELFQYDLDYSFLGPEIASSSLANFNKVVAGIREIFPQAILDDRLMKLFPMDIPTATVEESIEINCKLIYLRHQATAN